LAPSRGGDSSRARSERPVEATGLGHPPDPCTDPVASVRELLAAALERAGAAGIAEDCVVLDPGIGFFRDEAIPWDEWDARVLAGLGGLGALGRPLCIAVSRKSFIGAITGRTSPGERLAGSLAATAVAVLGGAALVRAHDVAETLDAVRVAERIRKASRAHAGPYNPYNKDRP
ncbi:MAG: dihydropteroate synthase, partial [Candidatus Rokuibacteriota bacterium]